MIDLHAAVADLRTWQEALYQDLHRHPELSLQEHATAERIETELRELGLTTERIGGTGVVAVIENGDGPTVLERADIDGLPVTEASGLPYASEEPGRMHACGHDVHISTLLGAVRVLVAHRDAWQGTFIALFQPAEETAQGARAMVADGLVDRIPRPDVALAQHVMPGAAGRIGTLAGPLLCQGESLRVTIHGRGAHGSVPHSAQDPVVVASAIVLRLQSIVTRELRPGTFGVVTVGALNAGTKSNIIPATAELLLNVRTYDPAVREHVLAAIRRIVDGECAAAGIETPADIELYDAFPLTSNDPEVTATVTAALTAALGEENVEEAEPTTGSEDFSCIPDAFGTPYTSWVLGGFDPEAYDRAVERGTVAQDIPANHAPDYTPVMQPTLSAGTTALVAAALAYLGS